MNSKEVAQMLSEVDALKKELTTVLQNFKDKKISQQEALIYTKIIDGMQKTIVTTITLDGIKQAIQHRSEEQFKDVSAQVKSGGRSYTKVNYRR